MIRAVFLTAGTLLLAGCANVNDQYKSLVGNVDQIHVPQVIVKVSSQDAPSASAKPALTTTLSDHAQAELAKLGARAKGATLESVAQALTKVAAPPTATMDGTKLTKQIVATINYANWYLPDDSRDRIQCAVLMITPKNAVFRSWDQVKTSFASISLGSAGSEQDFTLSGEIDPKLGGAVSAAKVTPSYTLKSTESRTLSDRVIALSGQLSADRAVIFQQGAPTQDLVGNTVLNVVLDRTHLEVVNIFSATDLTKNNVDANPREVSLRAVLTTTSADPVSATVQFGYVLRHVVNGFKSLQENDDTVAYVQGPIAQSDLTIDPGQPLFEIRTKKGAVDAWPLDGAAKPQKSGSKVLLFASVSDAQTFFNWLVRQHSGVLKNFALYTNEYQPLKPGEIADIHQVDQAANYGPSLPLPIYESRDQSNNDFPTSCQAAIQSPAVSRPPNAPGLR